MQPMIHAIDNTINPYIYALSATEDNIDTIIMFIRDMSNIASKEFKCKSKLGQIFDAPPNISILTHTYGTMSFPTWHSRPQLGSNAHITAAAYASATGHMTPFQIKTPLKPLRYPPTRKITSTIPEQVNPDKSVTPGSTTRIDDPDEDRSFELLYLMDKQERVYQPDDDVNKVNTFSMRRDLIPSVLYFDPYNAHLADFTKTVKSGITIETSRIASFTVPQPSPTINLQHTNSQFLNSAVPAHLLIPAWQIAENAPFYDFQINSGNELSQHISHALYDFSTHRIPRFPAVMEPDPLETSTFHGFEPVYNIPLNELSSNRCSFNHESLDNNSFDPKWPKQSFHAWSSYRYFNTHSAHPNDPTYQVSMLLNMRTLYGTNVTMAKGPHPFKLLPSA